MSSFEESSRTGPICPRCGTENLSEAVFCKKCGKRLDGMSVCPNCGKLTPADGEFCIFCGANRNSLVEKTEKSSSMLKAKLPRHLPLSFLPPNLRNKMLNR